MDDIHVEAAGYVFFAMGLFGHGTYAGQLMFATENGIWKMWRTNVTVAVSSSL
jgi:hypothetical protein